MATPAFQFQELFELGEDSTEYRLLTKEHVRLSSFGSRPVLEVDAPALTLLCSQAFHDINFFLRPAHLRQVAAILDDPDASENDRMVALTMLKNADVSSAGVLPFCQDTGTAIVLGKKGNSVWSVGMKRLWQKASTTPTRRTTSAIHKMHRYPCGMKRTPARTFLVRLNCRPSMARSTSFSSSPKGWKREQVVFVPRDASRSQSDQLGSLFDGEDDLFGYRCLSAVPLGICDRRNVGGIHHEGREIGLDQVLGPSSDDGQRAGKSLSRCGARGTDAGRRPQVRYRCSVRR